jgi:hypothetical protein
MTNLVQGSKEYPYHISVGAVLVNSERKVCAHYFDELQIGSRKAKDFYILMRETPEPGESLEATLERGLREEFGATATTRHFIGSVLANIGGVESLKEKTTLYFLCDVIAQEASLRENIDAESSSKVGWYDPDFLIARMKQQSRETGYEDIDESMILERAQQYLS